MGLGVVGNPIGDARGDGGGKDGGEGVMSVGLGTSRGEMEMV